MRLANEGHHVMLANAVKWDIPKQNNLVIILSKNSKVFGRIEMCTGEKLGIHLRNASGSIYKAFTINIFAKCLQYFDYRLFDSIGIDMTEAMVEKAKKNAEKLGYKNVEFHLGEIENTPLEENSTDIVVSNCVFNLAPDKSAAFRETFRILRPGGHLSISDIVTDGVLPEVLLKEAEMYAGCVAGALQEDQYLNIIRETGFGDVTVMKKRKTDLPEDITDKYGVTEELNRPGGTGIYSITVFAKKPQN